MSMNDAVIFILFHESKILALKSMLERQGGSKVSWKSEVANVNNFLHAYSNSKILHFTGHGENGGRTSRY